MKLSPRLQLVSAVAGAALTAYFAELSIREREREAFAEGVASAQEGLHGLPHPEHPSQFDPETTP